MPVQLRAADSPRLLSSQSECSILRLVGIVSIQNGHYTSLSEPFVESAKKLSESQTLVDESEWLLYNSKAHLDQGGRDSLFSVFSHTLICMNNG